VRMGSATYPFRAFTDIRGLISNLSTRGDLCR
jgi:hypothetical protein